MSDRISEIIKEAEQLTDSTHFNACIEADGTGGTVPDWHDTLHRSIALLLIQECTDLTLDYKNDDHYNGWLDFRDEIRKHFGIEEVKAEE